MVENRCKQVIAAIKHGLQVNQQCRKPLCMRFTSFTSPGAHLVRFSPSNPNATRDAKKIMRTISDANRSRASSGPIRIQALFISTETFCRSIANELTQGVLKASSDGPFRLKMRSSDGIVYQIQCACKQMGREHSLLVAC